MTVLVDPARWPSHGRLWAHLVSDSSQHELHAFAAAAGLPPGAFEGDHYDVPAEHRDAVVALGAQPVSARELLERLVASGLRRPKRRGERVIGSASVGAGRVDVVLSGLTVPVERTTGASLLLAGDERPGRGQVPSPVLSSVLSPVLFSVPSSVLRDGLPAGAVPVGHMRHHPALDAPARDWTYHAVLQAGTAVVDLLTAAHPVPGAGDSAPAPHPELLELLLARLADRSS